MLTELHVLASPCAVHAQAGVAIQELSALNAAVASLKAENTRVTAAHASETDAHKETQRELRKLKRWVV